MIIGIPKESWGDERRVALDSGRGACLKQTGHSVLVQAESRRGLRIRDGGIPGSRAAIGVLGRGDLRPGDLLLKVMPPTIQECGWIPEHGLLFSVVHLGAVTRRCTNC